MWQKGDNLFKDSGLNFGNYSNDFYDDNRNKIAVRRVCKNENIKSSF